MAYILWDGFYPGPNAHENGGFVGTNPSVAQFIQACPFGVLPQEVTLQAEVHRIVVVLDSILGNVDVTIIRGFIPNVFIQWNQLPEAQRLQLRLGFYMQITGHWMQDGGIMLSCRQRTVDVIETWEQGGNFVDPPTRVFGLFAYDAVLRVFRSTSQFTLAEFLADLAGRLRNGYMLEPRALADGQRFPAGVRLTGTGPLYLVDVQIVYSWTTRRNTYFTLEISARPLLTEGMPPDDIQARTLILEQAANSVLCYGSNNGIIQFSFQEIVADV